MLHDQTFALCNAKGGCQRTLTSNFSALARAKQENITFAA